MKIFHCVSKWKRGHILTFLALIYTLIYGLQRIEKFWHDLIISHEIRGHRSHCVLPSFILKVTLAQMKDHFTS